MSVKTTPAARRWTDEWARRAGEELGRPHLVDRDDMPELWAIADDIIAEAMAEAAAAERERVAREVFLEVYRLFEGARLLDRQSIQARLIKEVNRGWLPQMGNVEATPFGLVEFTPDDPTTTNNGETDED